MGCCWRALPAELPKQMHRTRCSMSTMGSRRTATRYRAAIASKFSAGGNGVRLRQSRRRSMGHSSSLLRWWCLSGQQPAWARLRQSCGGREQPAQPPQQFPILQFLNPNIVFYEPILNRKTSKTGGNTFVPELVRACHILTVHTPSSALRSMEKVGTGSPFLTFC